MIDLEISAAQMLAEIDAPPRAAASLTAAPRPGLFAEDVATITVRGRKSGDLMPMIDAPLAARLADVKPDRLWAELLAPVKKAIGNAYKRGNLKDDTKQVTVQAMVTERGAVVAVSDEGEGFDVEGVLGRRRRDECYFSNHGSGFAKYDKTRSRIGFAHGGRTLILLFKRDPEPGREPTARERADLGVAAREDLMKTRLAESLPELGEHGCRLDACHVYIPYGPEREGELCYRLDRRFIANGQETRAGALVLSGRLSSPATARAELAVAAALRKADFGPERHVGIPRPVIALVDPPLALFELNPATDLRAHVRSLETTELEATVAAVARGLRGWHSSDVPLDLAEDVDAAFARYLADAAATVKDLAARDHALGERAAGILAALRERAAAVGADALVAIHGDFGWHRVICDGDKLLFQGFDTARRGHRGFDLGGALADMMRSTRLRDGHGDDQGEGDLDPSLRETFLGAYAAGAEWPWADELPVFLTVALLIRARRLLDRAPDGWASKMDEVLRLCEAA